LYCCIVFFLIFLFVRCMVRGQDCHMQAWNETSSGIERVCVDSASGIERVSNKLQFGLEWIFLHFFEFYSLCVCALFVVKFMTDPQLVLLVVKDILTVFVAVRSDLKHIFEEIQVTCNSVWADMTMKKIIEVVLFSVIIALPSSTNSILENPPEVQQNCVNQAFQEPRT
jgi:hypothetical protein